MYIIKPKKNVGERSFNHRAVAVWNNLPERVVEAKNINVFKGRLDRHWSKEELKYDYTKAYNKMRTNVANDVRNLLDRDSDTSGSWSNLED